MSTQEERDAAAARRAAEDLDAKRRLRRLVQAAADSMEPIHPLTVVDVLLVLAGEYLLADFMTSRGPLDVERRDRAASGITVGHNALMELRRSVGLAP